MLEFKGDPTSKRTQLVKELQEVLQKYGDMDALDVLDALAVILTYGISSYSDSRVEALELVDIIRKQMRIGISQAVHKFDWDDVEHGTS
jgi:hypothetical protein